MEGKEEKHRWLFKSFKKLLVFSILFLFGRLLVNKMAISKETDMWLCKNDR